MCEPFTDEIFDYRILIQWKSKLFYFDSSNKWPMSVYGWMLSLRLDWPLTDEWKNSNESKQAKYSINSKRILTDLRSGLSFCVKILNWECMLSTLREYIRICVYIRAVHVACLPNGHSLVVLLTPKLFIGMDGSVSATYMLHAARRTARYV